jgi:hypothetical protein
MPEAQGQQQQLLLLQVLLNCTLPLCWGWS